MQLYQQYQQYLAATSVFRAALKKKRPVWREYINSQDKVSRSRYITERNIVAKLPLRFRRNYENHLTKQINVPKAIKQFFQYAKHQTKGESGNVSLFESNGNVTSDEQTANTLSDYYSTAYNTPLERGSYETHLAKVNSISEIEVIGELILQQLELLNDYKFPGHDDINLKLLKRYSRYFVIPLFHIFLRCIKSGIIPQNWKMQILSQFTRETLNYLLRIIRQSHSHQ